MGAIMPVPKTNFEKCKKGERTNGLNGRRMAKGQNDLDYVQEKVICYCDHPSQSGLPSVGTLARPYAYLSLQFVVCICTTVIASNFLSASLVQGTLLGDTPPAVSLSHRACIWSFESMSGDILTRWTRGYMIQCAHKNEFLLDIPT